MIPFDPHGHRFPSRRALVFGSRGMVATSHPQAAMAGLETLKKGGNAVDAAVAAAAALTVTEPTGNGLGSDALAIIWKDGRLWAVNGSGPAPKALSRQVLTRLGMEELPPSGWLPVCVPGAVAVWAALSHRLGRLNLAEALAPAVELARSGAAVPASIAQSWARAEARYRRVKNAPELAPWFDTFLKDGRPPLPGETMALKHHAKTLELIGSSEGEAFYRGELAERIGAFSAKTGGLITAEDLADYSPRWVDPLSRDYRGITVWEMPPNSQGLVALMALGILDGLEAGAWDDPMTVHRRVEAVKLAFADGRRYIADPDRSFVPAERLLSDHYLSGRRSLVSGRAAIPAAGELQSEGTVYLAAADGQGTMVSMIQSSYGGFGSGVVVPGTGIALNNRGLGFSMETGHPNELAPGKRPYHTIIPGFLTKGSEPIGPFGVMGACMQPQGHVQVLTGLLDHRMNPQEALDAPRWRWTGGLDLAVEQSFPSDLALALERMGHNVRVSLDSGTFGRGQIIFKTPQGALAGATEPRADGAVLGW